MVISKSKQKKIPVEMLQEEHLTGPASESMEEIKDSLEVGKIVFSNEKPDYEEVIFRNQRDPGYPLECHYSSKTHPFKQYTLIDGQTYTLSREFIKHLEGCRENIEKYRKSQHTGLPEIYIAGYKTHFVCERAA